MKVTLTVPDEVGELPIVASVSGGKDSTALILALREAEIPFRAVFADTGWEAQETYDYLDLLREKLSLAIDVVGRPGGMEAVVKYKQSFPSRLGRWCTSLLKIEPLQAYHLSLGVDTVSAVGIRAEESFSRSKMTELEDTPFEAGSWGGWIWRPLLRWTLEDVLEQHSRHGIPLNPLYLSGHDRVGCYPCIFSQKEEIRLIAERAPERIDLIRRLEDAATASRKVANAAWVPTAARPVRYPWEVATFFQGRRTDKHGGVLTIDRAVEWSRTDRRGGSLLMAPPTGGCMRWGLCESPKVESADEGADVDGDAEDEGRGC